MTVQVIDSTWKMLRRVADDNNRLAMMLGIPLLRVASDAKRSSIEYGWLQPNCEAIHEVLGLISRVSKKQFASENLSAIYDKISDHVGCGIVIDQRWCDLRHEILSSDKDWFNLDSYLPQSFVDLWLHIYERPEFENTAKKRTQTHSKSDKQSDDWESNHSATTTSVFLTARNRAAFWCARSSIDFRSPWWNVVNTYGQLKQYGGYIVRNVREDCGLKRTWDRNRVEINRISLSHPGIPEEIQLDNSSNPVLEAAMKEEVRQIVQQKLATLDETERSIIIQKFGIDGKGSRTFHEIAESICMKTDRVKYLYIRVLEKLKPECGGLAS